MPHLDDSDVAAALDTIPSPQGTQALAHASGCAQCGVLLRKTRDADAAVRYLLQALDHQPREVALGDIVAAASQPSVYGSHRSYSAHGQTSRVAGVRRFPQRALRLGVGAGILGVAAAAAAAAGPRAVVHDFWTRLVGDNSHASTERSEPTDAARVTYNAPPSAMRGVTIVPTDSVVVTFKAPQHAGVIRVLRSSSEQVEVAASADGPTYVVGSSTILVNNGLADSASYDIRLPDNHRLTEARIRVGTKLVYDRAAARVVVPVAARPDGEIVLSLRTRP